MLAGMLMVSFPAGNHKRMGNYGSRQFSGTKGVGLQPRFLGGSPRFKVQTPSVNPARRIGPIWPLTICWSPEKPQFRKEVPSEKGHVSWPLPDSGSVHLRLMNRGGQDPFCRVLRAPARCTSNRRFGHRNYSKWLEWRDKAPVLRPTKT